MFKNKSPFSHAHNHSTTPHQHHTNNRSPISIDTGMNMQQPMAPMAPMTSPSNNIFAHTLANNNINSRNKYIGTNSNNNLNHNSNTMNINMNINNNNNGITPQRKQAPLIPVPNALDLNL